MPFNNHPKPETLKSLANVKPIPFWMDDPEKPEPADTLTYQTTADLAIIGAGFTGLWCALLAKESDPARDVVLLECGEAGNGASGRNGGFVSASLTHNFDNGLARWPKELSKLIQLGRENLDAIEESLKRYNIDCDYIHSGELTAATEPYQIDQFRAEMEISAQYGEKIQFIEQAELRKIVNSPIHLAGSLNMSNAMLNPARLVWGLRRACLGLGVRLFERTQVTGLENEAQHVLVKTQYGQVCARRVALATNAFHPLLKRLSYYIAPVYDYALMTEPLSKSQHDSIGWYGRQGLGDSANQFHYSQMTSGGCILWGGYDAIYYWNNGFGSHLENNPASFGRLAEHFFQTFPQLEGLRFTHAWGGAIDTCSRFSAFWGKAFGGKIAYSLGYTGLGVGASRFGAGVALDLLDGKETERTALKMARTKPFPFPPEPFRSPAINFTRWSLDRADHNNGRRNLWLKILDALGLGFDT